MSKNYRSELVGVLGDPIDENPTGVVEEAAFAELGLVYRYITMLVKEGDLQNAIAGLRAMNYRGINLTIPHKVKVIPFLDELTEAAEKIGAVNTVINNNGKLLGENTDGKGFLTALENADISVINKNIFILGAGGAARAIAIELALAGAIHITIANRDPERGHTLTNLINRETNCSANCVVWDNKIDIPESTEILINATSIGLFPHVDRKPNINYETIKVDMIVSDVVFNDPNTLFLREAENRGAKTVNGLGMLVNQAAVNFELWTGKKAPLGIMEIALKKEFGLA